MDIHSWSWNGIVCAIGAGGNSYSNAESDEVTAILSAAARHEGRETLNRYRQASLAPEIARDFRWWLSVSPFPESGFQDPLSFQNWIERSLPLLAERPKLQTALLPKPNAVHSGQP